MPISDSNIIGGIFTKSTYPSEPVDESTNGGADMDVEKFIDRLDQDRRESEQRIREDRQQMETRLVEERRLSEERLNKQLEDYRREGQEREERIDKKFDKLSSDMSATKWAIIGLCITTLLGIAAMVVTVILK